MSNIDDHLQHDCLHYFVRNDIVQYKKSTAGLAYQIIPYCLQFVDSINSHMQSGKIVPGKRMTFKELHQKNVTSKDLSEWSASTDLIERYESSSYSSLEIFYNCTSPWFGDYCQYTFDQSMWPFSEIVKQTFLSKEYHLPLSPIDHTNLSCYVYLQCYRGPAPMCLDWREVCDNRIDCLDGGQDEQYCFQMEMNECAEDEYRCHNGMCIPDVFFHDDELNPDCVDGTDEIQTSSYTHKCYQDPAFRCSERRSAVNVGFSCGDDGYNCQFALPSLHEECPSRRDILFSQAIWSYTNHNMSLSRECWMILSCAQNLDGINRVICDDICELDTCYDLLQTNCSSFFIFPNYPIFGHIQLLYFSNETRFLSVHVPNYVCYNANLCDFIVSVTLFDNLTCSTFEELGVNDESLLNWGLLVEALDTVFGGCLSISSRDNRNSCESPNLFHCKNTSKCVSKHRVMDGVKDCYDQTDETVEFSCEIDTRHRFHCLSRNRCLPHWLALNGVKDCVNGDDEMDSHQGENNDNVGLIFTHVCDGFVDTISMIDNNSLTETDETNCEHWQCDNHYTHCDGVWNCPNGVDEVSCVPSSCGSDQHQCVSSVTHRPVCLPLARAGDGIVDCLGSYDERLYCREKSAENRENRYKCRNSAECVRVLTMCKFAGYCAHDKIYNICSIILESASVFKSLTDQNRVHKYFSLSPMPNGMNSSSRHHKFTYSVDTNRIFARPTIGFHEAWLCNRGIVIYVNTTREGHCLCPPSHFGDRCQYQNERVSLTIQFSKQNSVHLWRDVFRFSLMLIDDDEQEIHSFDQIIYVPAHDCPLKYNLNLLYKTRPKNQSKNFSVRIDGFVVQPLFYYASWHLAILFPFLPVNRLVAVLRIPFQPTPISKDCPLKCARGQCVKYENKNQYFCRCHANWRGVLCDIASNCQCSFDSVCVGISNNRSICVCPLDKFGPRCFLTHSICQKNPCHHGGLCIPDDERVSDNGFSCLCSQGFSGTTCQISDTKIVIGFDAVPVPSAIFAHFITVYFDAHPIRMTMLKKTPIDQQSITFYTSAKFHLLFAQIQSLFYVVIIQEQPVLSANLSNLITPAHRCLSIGELVNATISSLSLRQRVKYYHLVCRQNLEMRCFHDDIYLCLCTSERYGNCFEFDHKTNYQCRSHINYCQNGAECFQDKTHCPSALICACKQCYFGSRCQLSTEGFGLSLDSILGYKIKVQVSLQKQSWSVQVSIIITTLMFVVGLISCALSLITFRSTILRKTGGCCLYLFASSITSFATTIVFKLKLWLLIFSHIGLITNRSFILLQCIAVDFMLVVFLNINSWLNACVAFERALTVVKGVHFDKKKSIKFAKWILFFVIIFNVSMNVHDPIHRRLIDDVEERRIWCVVTYTDRINMFNSAMNIFHFFIPYCINMISVLVIILTAARYRAIGRTRKTYQQHLRQQVHEHKHLLISPCILILLGVPRMIIAFSSNCMKSIRDSWLFLVAYFISFIPAILIFVVFVLPSKLYKKELRKRIIPLYTTTKQHLRFRH